MSEQLDALLAERARVAAQLADPGLHADPERARELGRRFAYLEQVAVLAEELARIDGDRVAARELSAGDESFRAEASELDVRHARVLGQLQALLAPPDPDADRDVILEVKAGEGGEESALFAADILRMYLRFAERQGWVAEVLDSTDTELGGVRDASLSVRRGRGERPWPRLKYEAGVHRVQRVPVTESQGRIHTSAAGVLVLPEAREVEVRLDPAQLRIDVFRSSGPGGQSVNTTDSAVRITHLPTGIVVSCQNEKSQLQNRETALRILRARLLARAEEAAAATASAARASQVRTVDRSERIRTYNFPDNRVSDHRINYKAHNLDAVLDGDLLALVHALAEADAAGRLGTAAAS